MPFLGRASRNWDEYGEVRFPASVEPAYPPVTTGRRPARASYLDRTRPQGYRRAWRSASNCRRLTHVVSCRWEPVCGKLAASGNTRTMLKTRHPLDRVFSFDRVACTQVMAVLFRTRQRSAPLRPHSPARRRGDYPLAATQRFQYKRPTLRNATPSGVART